MIPRDKTVKIIYLVNHFKYHGGIERMLSNKIDAWVDEYGYDITVVTLNQEGAPVVYPPKNNFRLTDLGIKGVHNYKIPAVLKFINRVRKVIKKENPDIVITTLTGMPSLILPFLCQEVSKVLEIHSSGALSVTPRWKYKWPFLNRYNKVVVLNEDEKKYYRLKNLRVIPNFISPEGAVQTYDQRPKRIIAAGRIHPDKQYDHLIKIWDKLFKKYPDWSLDIYGSGDEQLLNQYKNYIKANKIDRITFHNAVDDLDKELSTSSILCLTSETESFSLILVESKKNMLPVISYDSPNGPRHIVKDDGILVAQNNISKFANELDKLMNDESGRKRMAENAKVNLSAFSTSGIIKLWNKLI